MSFQLFAMLMVLAFAPPSPGSTEHGPNFYSSEKEKEIGKKLAEETKWSYKLLNDPAVMGYIERVAQNLAKNSDARFPITVAVVGSDAVEACTLPGGYQFVSRGLLLQLTDDAELASVFARGIAHTALRSATTLATKAEIENLAITPVTSVPVGSSNPNIATSQVELMNIASIRREDEMDADYFGMQYMYKAGYDSKRFIDYVPEEWKCRFYGGRERDGAAQFIPSCGCATRGLAE